MKEEKIKITRLRCVTDGFINLEKDNVYILIRLHDDNEGHIQVELRNDVGTIKWYPSTLFEVIHND